MNAAVFTAAAADALKTSRSHNPRPSGARSPSPVFRDQRQGFEAC